MKGKDPEKSGKSSRRGFLRKMSAGVGAVTLAGVAGSAVINHESDAKSGVKIKLLSPEGKLVEVDKDDISHPGKLLQNLRRKQERDCQTGNS